MPDAVTAISAILDEHAEGPLVSGARCRCGWEPSGEIDAGGLRHEYRAHVASLLASHMAGAQAEAWAAGYLEGCKHTLSAPFSEHPPNPFTADTGNTE